MKIYLPEEIRGDWPIGHHLVAKKGVHEAVENQHGAVSVVLPNGLLGVKPNEFERCGGDEVSKLPNGITERDINTLCGPREPLELKVKP